MNRAVPHAVTHSDIGPAPIPARLAGLCDDAAIFPPGSAPLADAVAAHAGHRRAWYGELVGPLVLSAAVLPQLGPLVAGHGPGTLPVSVTVPDPDHLTGAIEAAAALPALRLVALEVALPADLAAAAVLPAVDAAIAAAPAETWAKPSAEAPGAAAGADGLRTWIEVPRDDRRPALLAALAGSKHRAKFRTGGVEARLYPDERELAQAVLRAVAAGVPFKATAGLHHAIRNTDPATGFEQHGFLNLLLATAAAQRGEAAPAVRGLLAERDGAAVARAIADLDDAAAAAARAGFASFGTCSVTEPLQELMALGLVAGPPTAHRPQEDR